jgi:hypothetical protein
MTGGTPSTHPVFEVLVDSGGKVSACSATSISDSLALTSEWCLVLLSAPITPADVTVCDTSQVNRCVCVDQFVTDATPGLAPFLLHLSPSLPMPSYPIVSHRPLATGEAIVCAAPGPSGPLEVPYVVQDRIPGWPGEVWNMGFAGTGDLTSDIGDGCFVGNTLVGVQTRETHASAMRPSSRAGSIWPRARASTAARSPSGTSNPWMHRLSSTSWRGASPRRTGGLAWKGCAPWDERAPPRG